MVELNDSMGRVQRAVALGSPVLVIGPGCHRIGYETTPAWKKVTARMAALYETLEEGPEQAFLRQFWESKLSDETRRGIVGQGLGTHAIDKFGEHAAAIKKREPARAQLAGMLLRALVECTRCLGTVISGGQTPVSNWLAVSYGQFGKPYSEAAKAQFDLAATAVNRATALAAALDAALPKKKSELALVHEKTLRIARIRVPLQKPFVEALHDMKISSISQSLQLLVDNCFTQKPTVNLSGALVEWLADLLWHVVISGAGVPPSQDELSFYLNLRPYSTVSERGFSRPQAGDIRWTPGEGSDGPRGPSLTGDVCGLLKRYDAPIEELDWSGQRESFVAMIASTLAQIWGDERNAVRGGHRSDATSAPRLVVALVSDYDLLLERALLHSARPDERFHVIIPVWARLPRRLPTLEWVFGTYVRERGDITEEDVRQPKSWTWLHEQDATIETGQKSDPFFPDDLDEGSGPAIGGPIIIKLTGSPLHRIGNTGPRMRDERERTPEPATIFSEHDSMEAMVSLAQTTSRGPIDASTLPKQLFGVSATRGLEWQSRSWLFFGHRFSDWLPRLRLFLAANNLGLARNDSPDEGREDPRLRKIAIDRSFDWPERTLLTALDIKMFRGDLGSMSTFYDDETDDALEEDIGDFLANVQKKVARFRARAVR